MYCKAEPLALSVCAEVTKLRYDTSRNLLSLISLCLFLFSLSWKGSFGSMLCAEESFGKKRRVGGVSTPLALEHKG
jgi:hypothetical protein